MKAIRYHATGGVDVLRYEDAPDPVPAEGEALVGIEAAGVNFIEVYQRKGLYTVPLPATMGGEGAGRVIAVGPGVTSVRVGDRVASESLRGSYAERAVARADRLVPLSDRIDAMTAAALLLQGLTAHYLLKSTYPITAGEWCVVHAAAGGVGLLMCQMAKAIGARVIGTASSAEKRNLAIAAGAEHAVAYDELVDTAMRVTGGAGVPVVYDSVGQATFADSMRCLRRRGMLVLFGQSSGPVAPLDPQALNRGGSLYLTRPTLLHYVATADEHRRRSTELLRMVDEGRLTVRVGEVFPLSRAADAHAALESRCTTGKLVLTV
jgi:NADPH2:quinone reductase